MNVNPVLEQAQWLARHGIYVNTLKPGTKKLVEKGPVLAKATRDADEIERRFTGNSYNLGVVTGADSNLLILDIDTKGTSRGREALHAMEKACGSLPPTLYETTPSGGGHLYYRLDGVDVRNGKLAVEGILGMEVFGRPHNVVAAPSVFNDNGTLKPYTIVNLIEPVPLSSIFRDYIQSHYVAENNSDGKIATGGRNEAMFIEACKLRRRNTPDTEAWEMLRSKNHEQCDPPLDEGELKSAFNSAWKYTPGYDNTELGNARRLVDRYGNELRYVSNDGFYNFTGGQYPRWVQDTESLLTTKWVKKIIPSIYNDAIKQHEAGRSDAADKTFKWHRGSQATKTIEHTLRSARSEGIDVDASLFDSDLMMVGVRNGVVNLKTGEFRKALREDYISKILGCKYDASAECRLWLQFLARITDNNADFIAFLQRMVGYILTGDTSERCFFFAYGSGDNGKSIFIEVVKALSGEYSRNMRTETLMAHTRRNKGGASEDEARLIGARLVTVNETNEGQRFDAALIKDLTGGGDTITARHLHKGSFEFVPHFKILMRGNHKPAFSGDDTAMARRLRLLPFEVKIPKAEQDGELKSKLLAELPGIFNWAIRGCVDWRQNGLGEPANVLKATAEYVEEEDLVGRFIKDCCGDSANHSESLSKLWTRFEVWCRSNGSDAAMKDSKALAAKLYQKGYAKGTRSSSGATIKGIKLTKLDQTQDEYDY